MTFKELVKEYYTDSDAVVEITTPDAIKECINDKSSCSWGSGKVGKGWYQLLVMSPAHKLSKSFVYVCSEENFNKAMATS